MKQNWYTLREDVLTELLDTVAAGETDPAFALAELWANASRTQIDNERTKRDGNPGIICLTMTQESDDASQG